MLYGAASYIARDSPGSALRVLDDAFAAARSLGRLALRGRIVPERRDPSIREIFVHRYRLMYRVKPESVEIIAFVHATRDLRH
jgi:plasmid stabilization system protein ParE